MAATSVATFMRIFSTLCATGYGEVQSVFIVGIVPPPKLVENFAPTTGGFEPVISCVKGRGKGPWAWVCEGNCP